MLSLSFIACANYTTQQGVQNKWRDESLPQVQIGKTTQAEVAKQFGPPSQVIALNEQVIFYYLLEQLGPPTTVSAYENGLLFMYEHIKTRERQLGLNIDMESVSWFQWLKFSFARGNDNRQALLMIFDKQGILQTRCYETWGDDFGGGFTMELFFSVQTLIDTIAYQDLIGPNQWGMSLLNPLPQTLNARQSLEIGQNGLELIATPTNAGQHTLEMR